MMVKSMSRKTVSFGQLLDYVNQPEEQGTAILQNFWIEKENQNRINGEFLENARFLPARRNGNILYHEILSFSDLDKERVTPAILEDLTRYYLSLRAPYALAYAKAHFNTSCPHVHLIISANDLGSTRRRRLSRAQFKAVKVELERYQREHYPFLAHSTVCLGQKAPAKLRRCRSESERSRRLQKTPEKTPTRKEAVRALVLRMLTVASSGEVFRRELAEEGVRIRCRGRTVTLEDNPEHGSRRYRLTTLGLEEVFWEAVRRWESLPRKLQALGALGREQFRPRWTYPVMSEVSPAAVAIEPGTPAEKSVQDRLILLRLLDIERNRGRGAGTLNRS
jgi:hypothetical protein